MGQASSNQFYFIPSARTDIISQLCLGLPSCDEQLRPVPTVGGCEAEHGTRHTGRPGTTSCYRSCFQPQAQTLPKPQVRPAGGQRAAASTGAALLLLTLRGDWGQATDPIRVSVFSSAKHRDLGPIIGGSPFSCHSLMSQIK